MSKVRVLATIVIAVGLAAAAEGDGDRTRAVSLYQEGRYAEALPILRGLDEAGQARGTDLYRLFFCEQAAGDRAQSQATLARAYSALEKENASATTLEVPFYLANALRNLGRDADASVVAADTTKKVESGAWPAPEDAMSMFQLAKLYEDQRNRTQAASWYGKSVSAFAEEEVPFPDNVRWARRYVATVALDNGDHEAAARELDALANDDLAERSDYDALARARARLGLWDGAAAAWTTVVNLDPAQGNDARYSGQLAKVAATLDALPQSAPADRPWSDLSKADLEELMTGQAIALNEARAEATGAYDEEAREEIESRVLEIRKLFIAAALEYALRGFPIRETAFSSGYAPLIFRFDMWELPPAAQPAETP